MRRAASAVIVVLVLALAGCNDKKTAEAAAPHELTGSAIGNYCGMNVLEHPGPKGQIILASRIQPVWFSSARDTLAFTMLPEEPKDIRAIYVSDMAKAPSWEEPGANNWVDAKQALFVVGQPDQGRHGRRRGRPLLRPRCRGQLRVRERRARPRLRGGAAGLRSRRRDRHDEFGRGNPVHSECRPWLSPRRQQGRPRTLRRSHGAFRHA